MVADLTPAGIGRKEEREQDQADRDKREHRPLPAGEAAARGDRDQDDPGDRHRNVRADVEVLQRERDADELGDDGQEVQDEQVADAEPAPEPAEPLVDEPGVPDAGDRAEPDHHLLVDDQHRDQQQQRPQQAVPVVLPGLRVGGHAAGVVVADHHDQPGAHDSQERDQLALEPAALLILIAQPDPAECALDIPEVSVVEHRAPPAELRRSLRRGCRCSRRRPGPRRRARSTAARSAVAACGGARRARSPGVSVVGVRRLGGLAAPPVLRQRDLEDVVDGDHAEQTALVVHDGDGDQVVVGHQDGHVGDVGVRADPDRIGVGHVDHGRGRIGLDQRYQPGHGAQHALVVDGVDAGQRLGLERGGLAHPGQRVGDAAHAGQGDEVHPHQPARAGGIEAHQGQHLGPLDGRQQVQDGLAALLGQLGDRVGRVVGAHPGQYLGDLLVRPRAEQPGGLVLVQFLEHVRLELGVGVHPAKDLGLLLLGGLLQQVGDLAGFSRRMRANGPRNSALPACPMSDSKSCQSRKALASLGWDYGNDFNADRSGWADKVKSTIPHIEEDEIYFLKKLDRNISSVVEGGSSSQAAPEE